MALGGIVVVSLRHGAVRRASPDGPERPPHDYNPALTVRRPDVNQYARSDYLDSGELSRLLLAIPRHTLAGLRDYALSNDSIPGRAAAVGDARPYV